MSRWPCTCARLNGAVIGDPTGNRTLSFDIGTVPALVDGNGNGNGEADVGEPGYISLTYQLIVGAGAGATPTPGDYRNKVTAVDVCDQCRLSNTAQVDVEVVLDPLFDLGTIIGKVFDDKNANNVQDDGEGGLAGAMVVLDDGSYVLTDAYGRYHFPAVFAGQRLLKINLDSLPAGSGITGGRLTRVLTITPGLLAKASFGVSYEQRIECLGRAGESASLLTRQLSDAPLALMGSLPQQSLLVNGSRVTLPRVDAVLRQGEADTEVLNFNNADLVEAVHFAIEVSDAAAVAQWQVQVMRAEGEVLRSLSGEGALPNNLAWDGLEVRC